MNKVMATIHLTIRHGFFKAVAGLICTVLWLVVFAGGYLLDSKPYREASQSRHNNSAPAAGTASIPEINFKAFFYAGLIYTPTNIAVLVVFAGFIGGCASNLTYERLVKSLTPDKNWDELSILFRTENPLASMLRSFLVYLGFMAGAYITTENAFDEPGPAQYGRLACLVSAGAFVVGYDPTRFGYLVSKITPFGGGRKPKGDPKPNGVNKGAVPPHNGNGEAAQPHQEAVAPPQKGQIANAPPPDAENPDAKGLQR
jgi:hypothetical protein